MCACVARATTAYQACGFAYALHGAAAMKQDVYELFEIPHFCKPPLARCRGKLDFSINSVVETALELTQGTGLKLLEALFPW